MRFALAGNPNSGKTTLFNTLTGSTAHVGNWPGVTVDRKEGTYKKLAEPITIIDLPGIYSLSPYSPEEVIARNYIIDEHPDLIINIVDATNIERNLYLTTQLLEMDCPVVVALNMIDVVNREGVRIDTELLAQRLNAPVIPISALRADNIKGLMDQAYERAHSKRAAESVLSHSTLGEGFDKIAALLAGHDKRHPVFHAVKLLEGDPLERDELPNTTALVEEIKASMRLDSALQGDFEAAVADARYRFITALCAEAVVKTKPDGPTTSDKIDKVLTSRAFGIPIFVAVMFLVFHFTFGEDLLALGAIFGVEAIPSPGVWLQGLAGSLMDWLGTTFGALMTSAGAAEWAIGLVTDGLIAGVGSVLSFVPQIMMLFLFLTLLEDSGYMSRAAFLMDRLLRRFGLSGKAFLPLLMGFGCSVPAMMGTRVLDNDRERRLTIMLMPFFSCGAKMPIWAMFSAAIFPDNADLVVFGVYFLGILTSVGAALILKSTVFKGEASPFIMELPAYRLPKASNFLLNLWEKLKGYIVRAATVIAAATVVIWFLANFSFSFDMVEANGAGSILGVLGNFIRPIFIPLGFASGDTGWRAVVAILTGLIAKEMVVSTMGVLYTPGAGDALESETAGAALTAALAGIFSPLAALSFMAFNLLSVPCMAAVAAMRAEMREKKWFWGTIAFWISTAWIVSFLIYNIGDLIFK